MQPGDIVLSLGPWKASRLIAWATRYKDEPGFSHASIALDANTILQAVPPKVTAISYADYCHYNLHVTTLSPTEATAEQRKLLVQAALKTKGEFYGLLKYVPLSLDTLCHTYKFSRALSFITGAPVCSLMVADAYRTLDWTFDRYKFAIRPTDIYHYTQTHPGKYLVTVIK
jgi:hypothetical protein